MGFFNRKPEINKSVADVIILIISSQINVIGGIKNLPRNATDTYNIGYIIGMVSGLMKFNGDNEMPIYLATVKYILEYFFTKVEHNIYNKATSMMKENHVVYRMGFKEGLSDINAFVNGQISVPLGFHARICKSSVSFGYGLKSTEVRIGNQIWLQENLDISAFRNGDEIQQVKSAEEWRDADKYKIPAWAYYENNVFIGTSHGKLYNWYAVDDDRGLAPQGWRVPNELDFAVLETFLGTEPGTMLKSKGGWNDMGGGLNASGFSSIPSGYRKRSGEFEYLGKSALYWTSNNYKADLGIFVYLDSGSTSLGSDFYPMGFGLSIRCIRD
jgi:uncharacterized protein (TIGR02145 family)